MMNYYYHPILGLQYDYLGEMFLIDIDCIPESDFDVEKWMYYMRNIGVQLVEPSSEPCVELVGQITDYRL